MKRTWQNYLLVLLVIAGLSGAVLAHYASGSRATDKHSRSSADRLPANGAENIHDGSSGDDSRSAVSTGAPPGHSGATGAVDSGGVESFHEWFQKYRAANPDMHRLRGELEAALAQLTPNDDAS